MTKADFDFSHLTCKTFVFYEKTRIGFSSEENSWMMDRDGMTKLHYKPSEDVLINCFLHSGTTKFIVEGRSLEVFCELAQRLTFLSYSFSYEHAIYAKKFGQRSIDGILRRGNDVCTMFSYALPDELIDQRDRLIEVINAAIRALRPSYARYR